MQTYHNTINKLICKEMELADKKNYTNNFISSLSEFRYVTYKLEKPSRGLDYTIRSDCSLLAGLGVYARYLHFPNAHSMVTNDESPIICSICTHRFEHKNPDYETMTAGQKHRMQYGFHSQIDALDNYHVLRCFNQMQPRTPSQLDLKWFKEILSVLDSAQKDITIKDVLKSIKNTDAFKIRVATMKNLAKQNSLAASGLTKNTELYFERFLEVLGFCSILDAGEHQGYFSGKVIAFPPRASWISDWYYPADFWKGSNGVNKEALSYWFGAYI